MFHKQLICLHEGNHMESNYFFKSVSFPFLIDLYLIKLKAEARNDQQSLINLHQRYPELFTIEFNNFIQNIKETVNFLDQFYNENFSKIFQVNADTKITKTH